MSNLIAEVGQGSVAPSNDVAYLEFEALLCQVERSPDTTPYEHTVIIRASFEYLAGQQLERVRLRQVQGLLRKPWRRVLDLLESYPPVAPLLASIQYPAAVDKETRYARLIAEAGFDVSSVLSFASQRKELAREKSAFEACQLALAQAQAAVGKSQRRRSLLEVIEDAVTGGALFAGGVAVGLLIANAH
jgi:hypothetical protein